MAARSSARYVAPIALGVVTVVLIVIVAGSGGGGSDGKSAAKRPTPTPQAVARRLATAPAKYTVRPGDSFLAIAQRTGVPTDQLQRLNPDIDPQVLVPGQRLKLRP
jgi:LysM repeat protein